MTDYTKLQLNIFNKMKSLPPLSAMTGKNWCYWKQGFLSFLKKEDSNELFKDQWSSLLLTLIGPFGEQAYKDLFFMDICQTRDLELMLHYLDLYFIFGYKKKQNDESIDDYIDSLMLIAIASNHSDPVSIVKDKIIQDIKNYNFMGKAMLFIQTKGEDLVPYLKSLDLHKITLFWKQCEQLMSPDYEMKCIRCGTQHKNRNRCPAHGQQCNNCKGYNHFTENCKVKYISNCTKCGTNHVQSRCLAFGELCMNCGKTNHFTWLCQVPIIKNCFRCGEDHAISMCPAQGHLCLRCNKPNHLEDKCRSKIDE